MTKDVATSTIKKCPVCGWGTLKQDGITYLVNNHAKIIKELDVENWDYGEWVVKGWCAVHRETLK